MVVPYVRAGVVPRNETVHFKDASQSNLELDLGIVTRLLIVPLKLLGSS